jgi:hypothetical protein
VKQRSQCRYSAKLELPALQLRPPNPTPIPTADHPSVHHVSTSVALSYTFLLLFNPNDATYHYECRYTSPSTPQTQQPRGKPRRHPPEHVLPTSASTANSLRLSARYSGCRNPSNTISSTHSAPCTTNNRRGLAPRSSQGQVVRSSTSQPR